MSTRTFKRTESAGGFSKTVSLTLTGIDNEQPTVKITYKHTAMGGICNVCSMSGTVVHRGGGNYMLVKMDKLHDCQWSKLTDEDTEYQRITQQELLVYLDMYTFDQPQKSDDTTGLTYIYNANTPRVPILFDCVIYKNRSIEWEHFLPSEITEKLLDCIDGTKLVSDEHPETCGWSWELNKDINKIGRVFLGVEPN